MENTNNNIPKDNLFKNINSNYILKIIFDKLRKIKSLNIIKYNKNIRDKLDIKINDYKEIIQTEIEIYPISNIWTEIKQFINISKYEKENYYHIFLNDNNTETKNTIFNTDVKVEKIRVILDYEFKSFKRLFKRCERIKQINFTKFNRKDNIDMSEMFLECKSLTEINFSNFNLNNYIIFNNMITGCEALEKLNFSELNVTSDVTDASGIFSYFSKIKEINVKFFNLIMLLI